MFKFSKEEELQKHIVDNFSQYFNFEYIAMEYKVSSGYIDILGQDSNTMYVIELKANKVEKSTLRQLTKYMESIKEKFPNKKIIGIAMAPKITRNVESSDEIIVRKIDDVEFVPNHVITASSFRFDKETLDKIDDLLKIVQKQHDESFKKFGLSPKRLTKSEIVSMAITEALEKRELEQIVFIKSEDDELL